MKYCTYCGTQLEDTVLFCPNCGARQGQSNSGYTGRSFFEENAFGSPQGAPRTFYSNDPLVTERVKWATVLSFIFPIVGLILWICWKDTKPGRAISAQKGALAGLCFNMPILGLIFWIIWKETNPELAKPCGISAIVGFVISFALGIVMGIFAALEILANPELYISLASVTTLL